MSRLDRHVASVQNKLALRKFVNAWAWIVLVVGAALAVSVLVERLSGVNTRTSILTPVFLLGAAPLIVFMVVEMYSRATFGGYLLFRLLVVTGLYLFAFLSKSTHVFEKWPLIGLGALGVGAFAYALWRRPSARAAAVAIDAQLKLKEGFSTALYMRSLKDPFAQATVHEAEKMAAGVKLDRQFPLTFPRAGIGALGVTAAVLLTFLFLPSMDLFGRQQAAAETKKALDKDAADSQRRIDRALEVVQSAPPALQGNEAFNDKVRELKEMVKQAHGEDLSRVNRKAEDVLKDVEKALKDEADRTQVIADKQTAALTQNMGDAKDYKSPVASVAKPMSEGDFSAAVQNLEKLVDNFDKLDEQKKKETAKEMEKLANQLDKAAQDPKTQEKIQKQLQQLGADKEQAKQMAQNMAQAAQGNQQAAQNLQKQAQQMQQQLQNQIQQAQKQAAAGNQQAAQQLAQLQQQQQAMNQAMQGMQGMANAQAQAGNMAQAAQQMAAGMKQANQGNQQQQPGAGQQQPQPQPGQQGNNPGQQQMAQGKQQMQQALGQMQAAQADANQAAARQQAAQQAGQQPGDGQGADGQQAQAGQPNPAGGKDGGQGQDQPGDPNANNPGGNQGGLGVGNGQQTRNKQFAPFAAKAETDLGASKEDGKILASSMVKGQVIKGEAKAGLAKITQSTEKAFADEVEDDHVAGLSRKAAEEYFRVMNQDATKK